MVENNSIQIDPKTNGKAHQNAKPHGNPVIPTISIVNDDEKPPPMYGYIPINGVLSKTLFDTGGSDNFVGTHFVTTNRMSAKRQESPVSIQQAVQGSKPNSNAVAPVNIKFGEWTKKSLAYVARLAEYDAIIGMPTLNDGDAVIYTKERKIHFQQWDFTIECMIPETPPKPPKSVFRWNPRKKPQERAKSKVPPKPQTATEPQASGPQEPSKAQTTPIVGVISTESSTKKSTKISSDPSANVRMDGTPDYYRELLLEEFADVLVDELPNKLPPLWEITIEFRTSQRPLG